jgi:hypothetical protein
MKIETAEKVSKIAFMVVRGILAVWMVYCVISYGKGMVDFMVFFQEIVLLMLIYGTFVVGDLKNRILKLERR